MYRIGREEIEELTKVINTRDLFKINNGIKESNQVEQKLKKYSTLIILYFYQAVMPHLPRHYR